MSDKTEYFNAKVAGDYLGEQWVVRDSDFDAVERQKLDLIQALESLLIASEHSSESHYYSEQPGPDPWDNARTVLSEIEAAK